MAVTHITRSWQAVAPCQIWLPSVFINNILLKHSHTCSFTYCAVLCLVTPSCLTLCDPKDCSLPGSSVHGDFPGQNTGVVCHVLLQGIFPTQGENPGLRIAGGFFTVWATREAQEYWSGWPITSPGIFPTQKSNQGPALQVDSLPAELPGKPSFAIVDCLCLLSLQWQSWVVKRQIV